MSLSQSSEAEAEFDVSHVCIMSARPAIPNSKALSQRPWNPGLKQYFLLVILICSLVINITFRSFFVWQDYFINFLLPFLRSLIFN